MGRSHIHRYVVARARTVHQTASAEQAPLLQDSAITAVTGSHSSSAANTAEDT